MRDLRSMGHDRKPYCWQMYCCRRQSPAESKPIRQTSTTALPMRSTVVSTRTKRSHHFVSTGSGSQRPRCCRDCGQTSRTSLSVLSNHPCLVSNTWRQRSRAFTAGNADGLLKIWVASAIRSSHMFSEHLGTIHSKSPSPQSNHVQSANHVGVCIHTPSANNKKNNLSSFLTSLLYSQNPSAICKLIKDSTICT